jgi:hypothetical protein
MTALCRPSTGTGTVPKLAGGTPAPRGVAVSGCELTMASAPGKMILKTDFFPAKYVKEKLFFKRPTSKIPRKNNGFVTVTRFGTKPCHSQDSLICAKSWPFDETIH